jgi:hypothetical protein
MNSNEASTGPPVSLQLLFCRHITYDGLCYMLDMLDNFQVKFNRDGLPVELRLIGTGQTTGPLLALPTGYNLLPMCENLPRASASIEIAWG